MSDTRPSGPDPDTIVRHITETYPETYPETDVVQAMDAWFFSLDPDKHFPNYVTIVTTDDHDQASNLSRPGVFRLNLGVDRRTFERLVDPSVEPDYTAFDRVLPHPVYAAQRWISIVNPSTDTWQTVLVPLIALAHDRLAAQRARHGLDG